MTAPRATSPAPPLPDGAPEGAELRAVEWFLREVPRDSDTTLDIVYEFGGVASECQSYGDTRVRYPEGQLIIAEWVLVWPDRKGKCSDRLQYSDNSIEWPGASLGDRALSGCRPGRTDESENEICRDESRVREDWPTIDDTCPEEPSEEPCINVPEGH